MIAGHIFRMPFEWLYLVQYRPDTQTPSFEVFFKICL